MSTYKSTPKRITFKGNEILVHEKVITSDLEYKTNGETVIVVKDVNRSVVMLDSQTTDHIIIKSLTNVLVKSLSGLIDDEYDEISLDKGACIELFSINENWYIVSSDGLKLY
jgi:hypothetical protein